MATDDWCPENTLNEFGKSPYGYGFFAAVRMMDCCSRQSPRTGWSTNPARENLRLRQEPFMEFPASSIRRGIRNRYSGRWEVSCNFLGFFGPQGIFPHDLTEYALARIRDYKDDTFSRFVDIFQHRMLSFFYRAFASTEPAIQHDRPEEDHFSRYVGSFAGYGHKSTQERDDMPDLVKFHFAGHLGQQNRHAEGLKKILTTYLGHQVEIREFVGRWLEIPEENKCQLGVNPATGSLGKTATLGKKIWECQQTIRLIIGPVGYDAYIKFLPGGPLLSGLKAVIKNYVGIVLNWEAQIVLKKSELPATQLGCNGKLGWAAWLISDTAKTEGDDLVLLSGNLAQG